jgi:hypothetical protein
MISNLSGTDNPAVTNNENVSTACTWPSNSYSAQCSLYQIKLLISVDGKNGFSVRALGNIQINYILCIRELSRVMLYAFPDSDIGGRTECPAPRWTEPQLETGCGNTGFPSLPWRLWGVWSALKSGKLYSLIQGRAEACVSPTGIAMRKWFDGSRQRVEAWPGPTKASEYLEKVSWTSRPLQFWRYLLSEGSGSLIWISAQIVVYNVHFFCGLFYDATSVGRMINKWRFGKKRPWCDGGTIPAFPGGVLM